jgi:acetyl esterase/lipase
VRHPAHTDDLVRATAFVHANAARFGGDAARLALVGHSAGAHMAMMAVLRNDSDGDEPLLPRGAVRAVAALSGVYDGELLAGEAPGTGALARCARRQLYMEPVFGLDRAAWPLCFPVGVLRAREREREAAVAVVDGSGEGKVPPPLPPPPPLPILLLNVQRDWTLETHTDVLFPLLLARPDLFDAERVSVEGGEHASTIFQFDLPGSLGDAVVAQGVAEWLLRRL